MTVQHGHVSSSLLVTDMTVANTGTEPVDVHFLLALEADLIRISPFVPATTSPPALRAAEIGLRINPRGILYTLPMAGSYVGGDITAGILASGMHWSEEIHGRTGRAERGSTRFLHGGGDRADAAAERGLSLPDRADEH